VDDEEKVLEGLQRILRPLRREWETVFASGGERALQILEQSAFDAIVTDMRMPGMDGLTLLRAVADRHPHLLRVVLSGQSDLESVVKSAGITHQYLSKPCPLEELKSTITRALSLRQLLADKSLKELVSRTSTIPSAPPAYVELMRTLESPTASMDQIGKIISRDIGMSAKVLQLVNSAFFGNRRHVSNPSEAAAYLGVGTIKALLVAVHVFKAYDAGPVPGLSVEEQWLHGRKCSALAGRIASAVRPENHELRDAARMAGLLHDAGRLVLACGRPGPYNRAMRLCASAKITYWEAERQVFGASHAEVGAYLLSLWGLPDSIVEALAFHHSPASCPATALNALAFVHLAESLLSQQDLKAHAPNTIYLERLGLLDRMEEWRACCADLAVESA
jgi:HD-like signal output (HDOD) protein